MSQSQENLQMDAGTDEQQAVFLYRTLLTKSGGPTRETTKEVSDQT